MAIRQTQKTISQQHKVLRHEFYLFFSPPGTFAVMSVMIGGVTERLAPDSNFMIWDNVTNGSIVDAVSRDAERVRVATAVTFMTGLFQVNIKRKD